MSELPGALEIFGVTLPGPIIQVEKHLFAEEAGHLRDHCHLLSNSGFRECAPTQPSIVVHFPGQWSVPPPRATKHLKEATDHPPNVQKLESMRRRCFYCYSSMFKHMSFRNPQDVYTDFVFNGVQLDALKNHHRCAAALHGSKREPPSRSKSFCQTPGAVSWFSSSSEPVQDMVGLRVNDLG